MSETLIIHPPQNSTSHLQVETPIPGLKLYILGRAANPIDYQIRDGSPEKNLALRYAELRYLQTWLPEKKIIILNQEHGDKISEVKDKFYQEKNSSKVWDTADGAITQENNFALTIVTADCLPIFLVEPEKKILCAVHAGWQGSRLSITAQAVQKMQNEYQARIENIHAFILPGISKEAYTIQEDVAQFFPDCVIRKNNMIFLDIEKANQMQLLRSGLRPENIYLSPLCTYKNNDLLFSHRKKNAGRNLNIIFWQ